jgi:hypothetical protein
MLKALRSICERLLLVWDVIFHMRKDGGFVCIFLYFLTGVGMYVGVREYTQTHSARGVLGRGSRGRGSRTPSDYHPCSIIRAQITLIWWGDAVVPEVSLCGSE